MSHQLLSHHKRTIPELMAQKGREKIVVLTAYTAPMAQLLDPACDILLVGDSLGMVVYGLPSTLPVTLDMMINHGAAVVRGASQALVVVDMPFGSYQASPEQAFLSCARVMKETGAAAIKLEGGAEMAETVRHLTRCGIPVMGHVGLMPQHMHRYGGFKTQGRDEANYAAILADAKSIAEAGAFSMVLEGIVEPLAAEITAQIAILTIGIGASAACDGQVLVAEDMLGLFERAPRFVKKFADLNTTIRDAAQHYATEVRSGAFPGNEHCYGAGPKIAADRSKKSKK